MLPCQSELCESTRSTVCQGSPPVYELYRTTGLDPQRAVLAGAFRWICIMEEHHGAFRRVDGDQSAPRCLRNSAVGWLDIVGWRNVKRLESQLEVAERCVHVVYTLAEETLRPCVTNNRVADWKDVWNVRLLTFLRRCGWEVRSWVWLCANG